MPDETKRGDHDLTDFKRPDDAPDSEALQHKEFVIVVEREAIMKRREYIRSKGIRDRTAYPSLTGLALSGGGIRSASFGLGALQALHVTSGIEGIDYLSTVSGGGYIGCSLTAAMHKTDGRFPFTNPENYGDTDSVRHIRDYSNYLAPFGALDFIPALGIILRGLVANVLIILPVVLFFVWITLITYPTVESLSEPRFLIWNLAHALAVLGLTVSSQLWGFHGYWLTAFLAATTISCLIGWAFVTSWQRTAGSTEVGGPIINVWKVFFFMTLVSLWFETQPLILRAMIPSTVYGINVCFNSVFSGECSAQFLSRFLFVLVPWLAPLVPIFASLYMQNRRLRSSPGPTQFT